jgi:polar amino acid transport system substrate-binding protein
MTLTRAGAATLTTTALIALAACSANGDDTDPDSSADGGEPNTEAPLYDQLPEEVQDAGHITFAADTHPPYRTIEESGEITGIDPELQDALSEQLGVPFELETTSGLDSILTGMLSGRFDAFNGPVRATPEREEDFDAIVWMTTRTSYLYLTEREDELADHEAVCGARVAGVTGSVTESQLELYAEWCEEAGLEAPEFIGLEDTNATVLAVNSDRADYAGTTQAGAIDVQSEDPGTYDYVAQSDEQGAGVDELALFLPKDNDLADPMFAAFENIFDNGEYERIMSDWGLEDVAVDAPVLNPTSGG